MNCFVLMQISLPEKFSTVAPMILMLLLLAACIFMATEMRLRMCNPSIKLLLSDKAVLASGVHNCRLHQSGYLDHSECISNHMQDMLSYLDGLGLFSTATPIVLLATIKTLFLLGFHIKFVPVVCALGSFDPLWVMILIISRIPLFQWTCVPFPRIISYLSYRLGQALFQGLLYP